MPTGDAHLSSDSIMLPQRHIHSNLDDNNYTDIGMRRSIITEEQKKELMVFYHNGLTSINSPLVEEAAEVTGLATHVIKNWIRNYKRSLNPHPDPKKPKVKPQSTKNLSGYNVFVAERLRDNVPLKEATCMWSSLDDGQKTKYNTEAATVNAAGKVEPLSPEQREITIKRHLKQLQIEVCTLEKLGVETVIVAFDTLQADLEVMEFGSKRATTFLDSTDMSTSFALHLKGLYRCSPTDESALVYGGDQMTSKEPKKRKSVDASLAVLTAVNDPIPSKKKAVDTLSSAVPSAGNDLKLLPGVCKEESSSEHQESISMLVQVKLEPPQINEEQQERSSSLVKVELEPLQLKEEQMPTGDNHLSSDSMLPQHHMQYIFTLDDNHTDTGVRRSIITEEQKKELMVFYHNGMTSINSPLVEEAAEATGLATHVIKTTIEDHMNALSWVFIQKEALAVVPDTNEELDPVKQSPQSGGNVLAVRSPQPGVSGLPVPSSPQPGVSGLPVPSSPQPGVSGLPVPSSPQPSGSGLPVHSSPQPGGSGLPIASTQPVASGQPVPSPQPGGSGLPVTSPEPGSSEIPGLRRSKRTTRWVGLGSTSPQDSAEECSDNEWEPTFRDDQGAYPADLFSDQEEEEDEMDEEMADASIAGDQEEEEDEIDEEMADASIAGDNRQPTTSSSAAAFATMKADGDEPAASPGWSGVGWQAYQIPFTGEPGPRCELDADSDPVSFFELFLTDELLQHICDETNRYAGQCIAQVPEELPHSRVRYWKDVDVPELKNFLGLTFLTGIVKKPTLEAFWSPREAGETPHFARTMSSKRFLLLKRFLHFSNNETKDKDDHLYNIRHVLDHLLARFRELYTPGQNISIDEGVMQGKGRLSFKVYNSLKPIKRGLKSYCLAEAETGYLWNMQPYTGEYCSLDETVTDLLGDLTHKGYHLYMDHFYNSVERCELLQSLGTQVCGTIRKNRGEPPEIKKIRHPGHLKPGETVMRHNKDGVMLLAWRDKNIVKMCNTIHPHTMRTVLERKKGQKEERIQRPACVIAYHKYMNGVDKIDKHIAYYPFARKTYKWSIKFVFYMFQLAFHNAFILHKAKGGKVRYILDFIMLAVEKWTAERSPVGGGEEEEGAVGRYVPQPGKIRRARQTDPVCRLNVQFHGHVLEKLSGPRDCRLHNLSGIRHSTMFWCQRCNVPLCVECFFIYHSEEKIKHYFK